MADELTAVVEVVKVREKATLQDFLAKKIKNEGDKNKTLDVYITSMDKTLTLINPSEEQILEYANEIGDNSNVKVNLEANRKFIYKCCPELQSTELHEALEIKDPLDVAKVLFTMGDVNEIMTQFNTILSSNTIESEIKN